MHLAADMNMRRFFPPHWLSEANGILPDEAHASASGVDHYRASE